MRNLKFSGFGIIDDTSAYIAIPSLLIYSGRFNGRIGVIVLNYGKVNYTNARVHVVEYVP